MIPKIIIWEGEERQSLLNKLSLKPTELLEVEGEGVLVDDFRHFINNAVETMQARPDFKLIIWSAELLSWEAQAVLLKPLEEVKENLTIYLVVATESLLAETIISRCIVQKVEGMIVNETDYWPKVLSCWKGNPADCLALAEEMEKKSALDLCKEVVRKLSESLEKEVNQKRIRLSEETLVLAKDLRIRNINVKMAVADYLLRTQEIIKS